MVKVFVTSVKPGIREKKGHWLLSSGGGGAGVARDRPKSDKMGKGPRRTSCHSWQLKWIPVCSTYPLLWTPWASFFSNLTVSWLFCLEAEFLPFPYKVVSPRGQGPCVAYPSFFSPVTSVPQHYGHLIKVGWPELVREPLDHSQEFFSVLGNSALPVTLWLVSQGLVTYSGL